jgi:hypothetical protein
MNQTVIKLDLGFIEAFKDEYIANQVVEMLEFNDTLTEILFKPNISYVESQKMQTKLSKNKNGKPTGMFGSDIKSLTNKMSDMNFSTKGKFNSSGTKKTKNNHCLCHNCQQ